MTTVATRMMVRPVNTKNGELEIVNTGVGEKEHRDYIVAILTSGCRPLSLWCQMGRRYHPTTMMQIADC